MSAPSGWGFRVLRGVARSYVPVAAATSPGRANLTRPIRWLIWTTRAPDPASDEVLAGGERRRGGPRRHVHLLEDVGDVASDRVLGEHQRLGDPLVAVPL